MSQPRGGYAILSIGSVEWTSDQIVNAIGLTPDRRWERGDILPDGGRMGNSGVSYGSSLHGSVAIDKHLASLVERLTPVQSTLASLLAPAGPVYAHLALYGESEEGYWSHAFQPQHLSFFGALRIPLNVNVKWIEPDQAERDDFVRISSLLGRNYFAANFRLIPTDQGGRQRAIRSGYQAKWLVPDEHGLLTGHDGPIFLLGTDVLHPGREDQIRIFPIIEETWTLVEAGTRLEMIEGDRAIGHAWITGRGVASPTSPIG